jgi:glycerol-3-phosphate acyltransferase PlsY
VRAIVAGNSGATNVLRTGHKGLAALTLLLDGLKGTAAVLVGHELGALGGVAILASYMAGLGAFLGHVFPMWLNFRGGKGVATYIGVLLGVSWQLGLAFIAIWIVVAVLTRYSSLSALVAALVVPIGALATGDRATAILAAILTALLLYKHRANIRRLAAGEEPKIGARA